MREPFKKLYKEFKLLNAFAIINDVAIQELMKDFNSMFFLDKDCQMIKENLELMINETHLKGDKKLLYRLSEDLIDVYAQLFLKGNKVKAVRELEARKSISIKNAIITSFFTGGSFYAIFMLISLLAFVFNQDEYRAHI